MINAIGLRGSRCLLQAGAFNSLWEKLERTFQDERLRQLLVDMRHIVDLLHGKLLQRSC